MSYVTDDTKSVFGRLDRTFPQKQVACLLVIILETSPTLWEKQDTSSSSSSSQRIEFTAFLDQVLVFVNAYLTIHQRNQVAILSSHSGER